MLAIFLELFHLITNPVWHTHTIINVPSILQMRKLRPENLPKPVSRAHKNCVSKSQRLWVCSPWSSVGQKGILPNSWTPGTLAKHQWSLKSRNHVLMKSDPGRKAHLLHALTRGIAGAWRFLNQTTLLCRQLGYPVPSALIPRGIKDGQRGGDNCHAIFKVPGSGMALVCSGFPLPLPYPVIQGLCFSTSWIWPWVLWGQMLQLFFSSLPWQETRQPQAWEYLAPLLSVPWYCH